MTLIGVEVTDAGQDSSGSFDSFRLNTGKQRTKLIGCASAGTEVSNAVRETSGGDHTQIVAFSNPDTKGITLVGSNSVIIDGTAEEVTFTPVGDIAATDVQAAIEELDSKKARKVDTWTMLAASAVAVSHTGDTDNTTLATVTVPAGALGPNGVLRVCATYSWTNSANDKTIRVRFGGASGDNYIAATTSTGTHGTFERTIRNRNSEASQVGSLAAGTTASFGALGGTLQTGSKDTSSDQDLVFMGQLADAGETITLEAYSVEVFYGA